MEELIKLVQTGALIPGIYEENNGYLVYQPIDIQEFLRKILYEETTDLAYNTQSMGRGIFTLKDGKFINYKGVDSQMSNNQSSMTQVVDAKPIEAEKRHLKIETEKTDVKVKPENCFKINVVIFPEDRLDIRIRGGSPLEDLEIEAEMNEQMKSIGIKQPKILKIKEFTQEFCLRYGLPIKIVGDEKDFNAHNVYVSDDIERQQTLRNSMKDNYYRYEIKGKRPETMREYLTRIGIIEDLELKGYPDEFISKAIDNVDWSYKLGQRYGQTIREVENPYRVSDLQVCMNNKNEEQIQSILNFSKKICSDENIHIYLAKTLAENSAQLLNNGWIFNQFLHKQDVSLSGELCDDEFLNYCTKIDEVNRSGYEEGKKQAIIESYENKYILQIYSMVGCLKTVSDAFNKLGIDVSEEMLDTFVDTFFGRINYEEVQKNTGIDLKSKMKSLKNINGRAVIEKLEGINPQRHLETEIKNNFERT